MPRTTVLGSGSTPKWQPAAWGVRDILLLSGAVLFPLFAIGVESLTAIGTDSLFDPLPTFWHLAAALLVPFANFVVWVVLREFQAGEPSTLAWLNGLALGISGTYTLLFLPVIPSGATDVKWITPGLLPFALGLAFAVAWMMRRKLQREYPEARGRLWRPVLTGVAIMALAQAPILLTRVGLRMAAAPSVSRRDAGIWMLRNWGQEHEMIRSCYRGDSGPWNVADLLLAGSSPIVPEEARRIYYLVTGESFDAQSSPSWGRLRGISLDSARLDGTIDAHGMVGYLEWNLAFHNAGPVQQEVRGQVLLPPGAAVSRVTAWVDGRELEADFGGPTPAKSPDAGVFPAGRDWFVVSVSGRNQVLVRGFAIPVNGDLKVRLGITAPLLAHEDNRGSLLLLPRFVERNFIVSPDVRNWIWIESPAKLAGAQLKAAQAGSSWRLAGGVDVVPATPVRAAIEVSSSDSRLIWSPEPPPMGDGIVVGYREQRQGTLPRRLIIVVDGSHSLEGTVEEIAASLSAVHESVDIVGVFAGSRTLRWAGDIGAWLADQTFQGGIDALPALAEARRLAEESEHTAIVWIHGPQPLLLDSTNRLRQFWERSAVNPTLYIVPAVPGPNRVAEAVGLWRNVHTVPRVGPLRDDLRRLFARWEGGTRLVLERGDASRFPALEAESRVSEHLAHLWAFRESDRLRVNGDMEGAQRLARRYRVVTAVSGAVVHGTGAR